MSSWIALLAAATLPIMTPGVPNGAGGSWTHANHNPWHREESQQASRTVQSSAGRGNPIAGPILTSEDRVVVRQWQSANPGWRPPPPPSPAMMDLLQPGHRMPRGVEHRAAPASLAQQLPRIPDGAYVVVGGSLILLDERTNTVVDVLWDVFDTGGRS
jgi:hypothetical protein